MLPFKPHRDATCKTQNRFQHSMQALPGANQIGSAQQLLCLVLYLHRFCIQIVYILYQQETHSCRFITWQIYSDCVCCPDRCPTMRSVAHTVALKES